MNKIKLYLDFDGVILDTITYTYQLLEKQLQINVKELQRKEAEDKKITKFFQELQWEDIIPNSPVINDSFTNISKLSSIYDITILTHVNSSEEVACKKKIIKKNIPDIPLICVPKQIEKCEYVDPRLAVLVDDYLGNLIKWELAGGYAIKFSDNNQASVYLKITNLNELFDLYDLLNDQISYKKRQLIKG